MLVKVGLLNNCVLDGWDISHPKGGEKKKKKKKEGKITIYVNGMTLL